MHYIRQHPLRFLSLLHLLCLAISIYPLWSVEVLPLTDYPNHLARAFIIHNEHRIPALDAIYDVHWQVAPYLAMEFALNMLQYVTDIYTAGKIFVSVSFALIVLGVVALNTSLFRAAPSWTTLLVYPFLYNTDLLMGFINFIFAMGVGLISLAAWLHWRRNLTPPRIALFLLILTLNYFSHLLVYGILLLTIFLYETFDCLAQKKLPWKAYFRVLSLLFLIALPHAGLFLLAPKEVVNGVVLYQLITPIEAFFSPIMFDNSEMGVIFLLLTIISLCMFHGTIVFHVIVIRVVAVLIILSLFIPHTILGIAFLHIRIPVFAMFLLISCIRRPHDNPAAVCTTGQHLALRPAAPKAATYILHLMYSMLIAGLLSSAVYRYYSIANDIAFCGKNIEELRQGFHDKLSPSAPMLSFFDRESYTHACGYDMSSVHLGALATIEASIFTSNVFTIIPPIKPSASLKELVNSIKNKIIDITSITQFLFYIGSPEFWTKSGNYYKYILLAGVPEAPYTTPANLELILEGSFFRIYENHSYYGANYETPP